MGTWGDGNFDSDAALDMLAIWQRKILDTIRETFTFSSEDTPYDGYGDAHIIANIDILITLCDHYRTCPALELAEILEWKHKYISVYSRFAERFTRSDDKIGLARRQKVVEDTFDRLYKITIRLCED